MDVLYDAIGDHALYIEDFIEDMKKVFPTLGNDWGNLYARGKISVT